MFEDQHTEVNLDKRVQQWRELQRYMADTVPAIWPYASPPRYEVVNKKIENYTILSNNSRVLLRQAWINQ